MSSTIIIKNSVTTGSSPSSLETGEFAINVADGNLFYGSGSSVKQKFNVSEFTSSAFSASSANIEGTLSLGGFANVSTSLASALINTDDLGSHTATQDLNMAGFNIDAAKEITASGNISASGTVIADQLHLMGTSGNVTFDSSTSGDLTIDAADDIRLDAGGADIAFKYQGTEIGRFTNDSSDFKISTSVTNKDIILAPNGTGQVNVEGNISSSGDIHSEYAYIGDGPHSHVVDRFLHLTSDSSVYFRMTSNTNGNSIIEFHNTQEPDFMIGSFFNVGGIQIRSEDKQYAKFGESGSSHQIELSGSVGITGPAAELNVAGDGNFTGSLTAAVKSFSIPHKTHKGKKLVYGVLEGPEHSVYIRGRVKEKQIDLPEEWTWLVDEDSITVQLTPIGKGQSLYIKEVSNSRIFIENDAMFSSKIDAYYTIHATRKDVKKLKTVQ